MRDIAKLQDAIKNKFMNGKAELYIIFVFIPEMSLLVTVKFKQTIQEK